jgi:hypothetical protein
MTLSSMLQEFSKPSSHVSSDSYLCNVCQCGKHVWQPFGTSSTASSFPFELLHCDIWTLLVPSISSYKYYLLSSNFG